DRVAIQSSEPFGRADRASLKQALNRLQPRLGVGCHGVPRQFGVGLAESGFAGSAAPTLDSALAKVPETLACRVVTTGAGHVVSPLALCGETSQNILWSEAWVTPRFGLAPTPAETEAGAF